MANNINIKCMGNHFICSFVQLHQTYMEIFICLFSFYRNCVYIYIILTWSVILKCNILDTFNNSVCYIYIFVWNLEIIYLILYIYLRMNVMYMSNTKTICSILYRIFVENFIWLYQQIHIWHHMSGYTNTCMYYSSYRVVHVRNTLN